MLRVEGVEGNEKSSESKQSAEVVTRECQREMLGPWDIPHPPCIRQKTLSLNTLDTPTHPRLDLSHMGETLTQSPRYEIFFRGKSLGCVSSNVGELPDG